MRKLKILTAIVVGLIVVVVLGVWLFLDVNRYRPEIQAKLEEQLQRKVTLGNMSPLVADLHNHHINNLDASIFKVFSLTEKFRLQFRAEAFNSLNRVRFGSPNTTVTAGANFGRITPQANDPRQMQFGLKLIW